MEVRQCLLSDSALSKRPSEGIRFPFLPSKIGGELMKRITGLALAINIAIFLSLYAASSSIAQSCAFSGNCPMPMMCQPGWFGGYCGTQACNADSDCRNGSACDLGVCQTLCTSSGHCPRGQTCVRGETRRICVTRSAPSPGGGGGGTLPGSEGGACGTIHYGQVTKHIGCRPGLRCSNPNGQGICRKPLA